MPRPPRPWFRFYSEALENRKVHDLGTSDPTLHFRWTQILCLANVSKPRGSLPSSLQDIAFAMRVSPEEAQDILARLKNRHFLDVVKRRFVIHEWDEWQKDSDVRRPPNDGETPAKQQQNDGETTEGDVPYRAPRVEESRGDHKEERERERVEESAPSLPFTVMYSEKYRFHEGRTLKPGTHAAAIALERAFGTEACIAVAEEKGWDKDPKYLRMALEDPKYAERKRKDSGQSAEAAYTEEVDAFIRGLGR